MLVPEHIARALPGDFDLIALQRSERDSCPLDRMVSEDVSPSSYLSSVSISMLHEPYEYSTSAWTMGVPSGFMACCVWSFALRRPTGNPRVGKWHEEPLVNPRQPSDTLRQMTSPYTCHVCGGPMVTLDPSHGLPPHPPCTMCLAPFRAPVEPTPDRLDELILAMYGDPTIADLHTRSGPRTATEALFCWAPTTEILEEYGKRLGALDYAELLERAERWPRPQVPEDAADREALLTVMNGEVDSGLLAWRIESLVAEVGRANEAERRHHRHILSEVQPGGQT